MVERMKIPQPRIIIVDPQYLVAMEVERILTERMACEVQIAMPHECRTALVESRWDAIVIDGALMNGELREIIRHVSLAGMAMVFTAFIRDALGDLGEFPDAQIVSKPFDDDELTEAVRSALALRLNPA